MNRTDQSDIVRSLLSWLGAMAGFAWKTVVVSFAIVSFSSAQTIGRVGSLEVSAESLRSVLSSLDAGQLESVRQDPALLEQLVRSLLVQQLVLKKATEDKWHEQAAVVAKLARTRDSTITESYLESVSLPPADYPSEDELKTAYQTNRDSLTQPRSFRLAQIFIADANGADEKLKAVQLLLKSKEADFAKVAKEQSQEPTSAGRGGEIGWVTEEQIEPDLRKPVIVMKLNETSEPIRLKDGWHLLKLLDARAAYTPTLEQVRLQLIKQLRQEKLRANTQAYLARLLKEHPLVLNETELLKILPEPSR